MPDPTPIRQGIVPATDFARELLDFAAAKIAGYVEACDTPPTSIALVLSGDKDGVRFIEGHSWDASETRTKFETCSVASAVLLKRAME